MNRVEGVARELCRLNFARQGCEGEFGNVDDCWFAFKDDAEAVLASLEADEPTAAWTWLAEHPEMELSHGEVDGDLSEVAWHVHAVHGGRNDREWTEIATGETPLEAVTRAMSQARLSGEGGK